jgi:hypothetical protein
MTVTREIDTHRLKRGATGEYDVVGYVHKFDALMQQRTSPLDETTARYLFTKGLPSSLAAKIATDPSGKAWDSFAAFRSYVLAIADAWSRNEPAKSALAPAAAAPRYTKKLKFGGERPSGAVPNHADKPSFVPGRTPKELNALRQKRACFKCGQPGHRAANCSASK